MGFRKNKDGVQEYYYKKYEKKQTIIQKDWFKENGHKRDTFPEDFFRHIESELTLVWLGYWAWAIDGDGALFFKKGETNKSVGISLAEREPIQFLADLYGSSISVIEFLSEEWQPSYRVYLTGKRCHHFLKLICPYMTEKKQEALRIINETEPNYHPPKVPMNFRKDPGSIMPHMGMVGGWFDTEGSVGIKPVEQIYKSKRKGTRVYASLHQWVYFASTNLPSIRKIKRILESWPFPFKPTIYTHQDTALNKDKKKVKKKYQLYLPVSQHLLFMKMFAPWILLSCKRNYADKFERKRDIYKMCNENKKRVA